MRKWAWVTGTACVSRVVYTCLPFVANQAEIEETFTRCCKSERRNTKENANENANTNANDTHPLTNAQRMLMTYPFLCTVQNCHAALLSACVTHGDAQFAEWFYSFSKAHNKDVDVDVLSDMFLCICENGHLEVAKWLCSKQLNWSMLWNEPFRRACSNGHLEVAKWFLVGKLRIVNPDEFQIACKNGHLHVAQWIVSVRPQILEWASVCSHSFVLACANNQLHVAKWLHVVLPVEFVTNCAATAFVQSSGEGNLRIMKWLVSIDPSVCRKALRDTPVFVFSCLSPFVGTRRVFARHPAEHQSFGRLQPFVCLCVRRWSFGDGQADDFS